MAESLGRRVRDLLDDRRADFLALLGELVEFESPSDDVDSLEGVLGLMGGFLESRELSVEQHPGPRGPGQIVARRRQPRSSGRQLLIGHLDTVWPLGTLSKRPFELGPRCASGPGIYDMKAGVTQMLFALDALQVLGVEPALEPELLLTVDEETGSAESHDLIVEAAKGAQRAFVLEPSLGATGLIKTARKGVGRFNLRILGRAAHAGLEPEAGASAIVELAHLIHQLDALNDPATGVTVNVGLVDGGMRPNVIAPEATAQVDVRVPTAADGERVTAAIYALEPRTSGVRLEISGGIERAALERTPRNVKLWEAAVGFAEQIGLELDQGRAGGGSDGNITSLYTATLDGLGAVGGGAHAIDEHIDIDRTLDRTALLAMLLTHPAEA